MQQRLRALGLYGLAVQDDALLAQPRVEQVIDIEDRERKRRSLERRLANARIRAFKPIADFDWNWQLSSLSFPFNTSNSPAPWNPGAERGTAGVSVESGPPNGTCRGSTHEARFEPVALRDIAHPVLRAGSTAGALVPRADRDRVENHRSGWRARQDSNL